MEDSRDRVRVDHQIDYATESLRLRATDTATGKCLSITIEHPVYSAVSEQVLRFTKECDKSFELSTDWQYALRNASVCISQSYRASTIYGYKYIKPEIAVALTYDSIPPEEVTACRLPRATLRNHIMFRFGLTLIWLSKLGDNN